MDPRIGRRRLLIASIGVSLATPLAGCTGDEEANDGNLEDTDRSETDGKDGPEDTDSTENTERDDRTPSDDPDLIFEEGQSHSFSGEGMAETEMFELDEGLMSIRFQSDSDDILTAHLVAIDIEGSGRYVDDRLIINRRAPIEGELMNIVSGGSYLIDVDVDGPWEFEIEQPSASHDEVENLPFERSDDQPVYYGPVELPEDALIHGEHSGEDGFTVHTITVDGHWDVPINDSGEVDSTRPLRDDGIAWVSIYGRDDWSIEIYEQED